jgi:alkylation response protein AidB-like acyl-CoA dehydrogenase
MNASNTASIPIGEEEEEIRAIRESVSTLCADFPGEYWREKDREQAYPTEFVKALTEAGFLSALIPEEYDIERKFRETRLYQVAPISTNLILAYLAEHVLGLPRSY